MNARGFTLVEILLTILIMILIAGVLFSAFRSFTSRRILDGASAEVVSALSQARQDTLDSLADSSYGVHFGSGSVVIFKGASYTPGDSNNRTITLTSLVTLTPSLTGGAIDITFARLTGKASVSGTVVVSLKADTSQTRTVTVTLGGISS